MFSLGENSLSAMNHFYHWKTDAIHKYGVAGSSLALHQKKTYGVQTASEVLVGRINIKYRAARSHRSPDSWVHPSIAEKLFYLYD